MPDHRFSANPIARAELTYQTRSRPQGRRWRRVATRIILVSALTLACILAGGEFAGVLLYRDPDPISRAFGVLNILPVATAFILHFVLMIQTLSLSANSVAREKQANNWDMLVLTGVDARQIICGKWWATVHRMWRSYAFLGILRAAMIIWLASSTSRELFFSYSSYFAQYNITEINLPLPANFLLAAGVVFAFTMVNLPLTAACGVSAFNKRSGVALARAVGTRLVLLLAPSLSIVAFTLWLYSRENLYNYMDWPTLDGIVNFSRALASTLIENGVSVSAMWVTYRIPYNGGLSFSLPLATLTAFAFYVLLTWGVLRLAQWQAVRQNALPPLSSPTAKTTYNA